MVAGEGPQPHDPEGFIREFREKNPAADSTVLEYLDEAVRCFNHQCQRAAAVLIGAASEKLILMLLEAFEDAIDDEDVKAEFQREYRFSILSKFNSLKDRLDRMSDAGKFPYEVKEAVASELPGMFQLVRRHRNSAGHPELATAIEPGTVFLSLRVFSEYVRRVHLLLDYFRTHPAAW